MCLHLLWSYYWNWISIIRVYEKNVMFIPLSDVLFYKVFFNRGIKMCQTLDRWNIPLTKYNKTANLWCQKSLHFKILQTKMDSNKAIGNINSVTKNNATVYNKTKDILHEIDQSIFYLLRIMYYKLFESWWQNLTLLKIFEAETIWLSLFITMIENLCNRV